MTDKLHSVGGVLVAWCNSYKVIGEDGQRYHFALHSPAFGWRAYRWNDESHGYPQDILLASSGMMWVSTNKDHLMCLQIMQSGEISIIASASKTNGVPILAVGVGCFVAAPRSIYCVHASADGELKSKPKLETPFTATWGHSLQDGAIMLGGTHRLIVLSGSGEIVHDEKTECCTYSYFSPFITRYDNDCLYYTDDPRKGWQEIIFPNDHREHRDRHKNIIFFTSLNDVNHISICSDESGNMLLYRLSAKSPTGIKYVGKIRSKAWDTSIVRYYDMICMAKRWSIPSDRDLAMPENNGFLAWDLFMNTFHSDIPCAISIPKISAAPAPSVRIHKILDNSGQQTSEQGAGMM